MGIEVHLAGGVRIGHAAFQTITALHTCEDRQHPRWQNFLRNRAWTWACDTQMCRFGFELRGKLGLNEIEHFSNLVAYLIDEDVVNAVEHDMEADLLSQIVRAAGSIRRAARLLEIPRSTLGRWVVEHRERGTWPA